MATYLDLQTRAKRYIIDAPTGVVAEIPILINEALRRLQSRHNFKAMRGKTTLTTTALTRVLGARPTLWKEARGKPWMEADLGRIRPLEITSFEREALHTFGNNPDLDFGEPRMIWEDETNAEFQVFPFPDGNSDYSDGEYRITIPYWSYTADLAANGDTNWFTLNVPTTILYEVVSIGFMVNWDRDRFADMKGIAREEWAIAINNDKRRGTADTQELAYHTGARGPHTTL